ncbi:BNR/Asp-box repeat family protein (plasmid) [Clostridium baratii str. Sullivan]|uniref:BNR/Asp-box repeat family protein n=1 Tax=Clostridium baratii str. Sullivan TaxID=1415775 RepID=A0A0A7G0I8_9CLOT|nr:hypothetical protein [Clostridium baratii]AIY85332.1 BNR/Asp-box repeat family protein [Clostridium baratii str. Sullivan]
MALKFQKIIMKNGNKIKLPKLNVAEFGFCKDTDEIFIGSINNNIEIAKKSHVDEVEKTLIDKINKLPKVPRIVNNLTTGGEDSALSAEQGKVLNSQLTEIANDFDEAVANVTNGNENATNSEIVQARGGKVNLNKRLDDFDSQLSDIETKKANLDTVFTMANMGQDIKESMTGGSVAVVGIDSVLTENIVDKQVTAEKTNFINVTKSINVFNQEEAVLGKYQQNATQVIVNNERYMVAIYVKEGDVIRATYNSTLADNPCQIFDKDGNRVGYKNTLEDYTVVSNSNWQKSYWQATMPSGSYKIIINGKISQMPYNMVTINNNFPGEYIEYFKKLGLDEDIEINAIKPLKEDLISMKENIFNIEDRLSEKQQLPMIEIDNSYMSILDMLSDVKIQNGEEITITIPPRDEVLKNATIRLGLHKSELVNNNDWNEIYSDAFDKNFNGIRFFDGEEELEYNILSYGNYDFIKEYNFFTQSRAGIKCFSDNSLVINRGTSGICKSNDNGASWIPLCGGISGAGRLLIFIDSKDNMYVMDTNDFKVYRYSPDDNHTNGIVCLDLSEKKQVCGDIQEAPNGYLFFGTYQDAYGLGGTVYRSINNGLTFQKVFHNAEVQHVHNISINKYTNPVEIFVGFDHQDVRGARCFVSKDLGETWTDVDIPYRNRDYAFDYCEENLYLGCGEANILGGVTIYKTTDYNDKRLYKTVANNKQGMRTIINIGDGRLLAGGCSGGTNQIPQLYLSQDKGDTWKTIWCEDLQSSGSAGNYVRFFTPHIVPKGADKKQILISGFGQPYTLRCFFGEDNYYAIAYVNVGDIPTSGKTIKLKTGYVINKDCSKDMKVEPEGLAFNVKFDKPNSLQDSVSGKEVFVENALIDSADLFEDNFLPRKIYQNKVLCLKNNSINLGKFKNLSFNKGFTFSFWMKAKEYADMREDNTRHPIIRFGNFKIVIKSNKLVIYNNNNLLASVDLYIASLCSEGYNLYTFTISNDDLPVISHRSFDKLITSTVTSSNWINFNLSDYDCVFGNNDPTFYSDMYNIADFKIYNKVLTDSEIMAIFHKRNYI